MIIRYHRVFEKKFASLQPRMRTKVIAALEQFQRNPYDPDLKNHALKGPFIGKRAFHVTGDIRIMFLEQGGYAVVLMLKVGTHAQVYGK